jgi:hypothetical protein
MPWPAPGGSAALLTNGGVLSYGYHLPSYASQVYDPFANTLTLTFGQNSGDISTGPLTLLGTGKALLAGGKPKYGSVTGVSLLYDPSTNRWLLTGNLPPRSGHRLTRLQNGLVLAVGRRRPSPAFLPAPNSTCRSALARETSPQSARLASCVGRATGPC